MSRFGNFGQCEAEDTCVLDPGCEFYEECLVTQDDGLEEPDR